MYFLDCIAVPSGTKKLRRYPLPYIITCLFISVCNNLFPGLSQASLESDEASIIDHWGAIQSYMNEKGVIFQTINTNDVMDNVTGGLDRNTALIGDLDLILVIDAKKLLNWDEATFFVYGLGLYGNDPSKNVGDIQAVSNIAAPNDWKLFEAWYQQNFLQQRFSILAGLYDVTSEFDVIRSSSELFLNGSFGTGPEFATSGINGPSTFPTTSLAIRGQAILSDDFIIRAVLADGVSGTPNDVTGTQVKLDRKDGLLLATELAYYDQRERKKRDQQKILKQRPFRLTFQRVGRAAPIVYQAKYAIGLWGYTTDFNDLSEVDLLGRPLKRDMTYGVYGFTEKIVYREPQDREQNLTLFTRIGFADPRVNRFSQYYGGGMVYRGLLPNRENDEIGIGVAAAFNSSHFERAQQRSGNSVDTAEIAVEMTYAINVRSEIIIQPNIQYIINPDTNPAIQNALVVGARVEFNLNWFEGPTTAVEIQK